MFTNTSDKDRQRRRQCLLYSSIRILSVALWGVVFLVWVGRGSASGGGARGRAAAARAPASGGSPCAHAAPTSKSPRASIGRIGTNWNPLHTRDPSIRGQSYPTSPYGMFLLVSH